MTGGSPTNQDRLQSRLRNHRGAMARLLEMGVLGGTVELFGLGLKEPYAPRVGPGVTDALCFPVTSYGSTDRIRYAYAPIPGITTDAPDAVGWGPGESQSYWSRDPQSADKVVVVGRPLNLWLLHQFGVGVRNGWVIVCPSLPGDVPAAWQSPNFWSRWDSVVLVLDEDPRDERLAAAVLSASEATPRRASIPTVGNERWHDLLGRAGGVADIRKVLEDAPLWTGGGRTACAAVTATAGRCAVEPLAIDVACVEGAMFYPFTVERTRETSVGPVSSYEIVVLRSDGALLDLRMLPAPPGTPLEKRVSALSDGTRVNSSFVAGGFTSWSQRGIDAYVRTVTAGASPSRGLGELLEATRAVLRSRVSLTEPQYTLVAIYVAVTHCYPVLATIPAMAVVGPRDSGKSRLADAVCDLGRNGAIVGQSTVPALLRLIGEARGIVVIEDLPGPKCSVVRGGDIAGVLAASYRRGGARRPLVDRRGRVRLHDFFGPRMFTTRHEPAEALSSRSVFVRTAPVDCPPRAADAVDSRELRDELHAWAMSNVASIQAAVADATADEGPQSDLHVSLMALARLAGARWKDELRSALLADAESAAAPAPTPYEERSVIRGIVHSIAPTGGEVATCQIAMEIALAGTGAVTDRAVATELTSRLGADAAPVRQRFRSMQTRVYRLPGAGTRNALSFCTLACATCRYASVCPVRADA